VTLVGRSWPLLADRFRWWCTLSTRGTTLHTASTIFRGESAELQITAEAPR
jgi:hypothetical protein